MFVVSEPVRTSSAGAQRSSGAGRLSVVSRDGETRLEGLFQQGCAKLRIPKGRDRSILEAVMINTAGGMTGGDRLAWTFEAGPGTKLTITSQACEKVYKSVGGIARTDATIRAMAGSTLAWLPQETILFDRCAFQRTIDAEIDTGAEALFIEAMVFGRRSMGEIVRMGDIRDRWRIRRNGRLIHAEEFRVHGNVDEILSGSATSGGRVAVATLLLLSFSAEARLADIRDVVGDEGGVSCWNGKLLARIVTQDGYQLRKRLCSLVTLLNPGAMLPKVWAV